MSTKFIVYLSILSLSFFGCKNDLENNSSGDVENASTEQSRLMRQAVTPSDGENDEDPSCLQQCGREARNVVYANCPESLSEQENCAITGREWYRNCLVDRCDESAVEQDNCKTECRLIGKREYEECTSETEYAEACRTNKVAGVQACLAECDQQTSSH